MYIEVLEVERRSEARRAPSPWTVLDWAIRAEQDGDAPDLALSDALIRALEWCGAEIYLAGGLLSRRVQTPELDAWRRLHRTLLSAVDVVQAPWWM